MSVFHFCPQCGDTIVGPSGRDWKYACGKCCATFVIVDITNFYSGIRVMGDANETDELDLLSDALDYVDSPLEESEVTE